MQDLSNKILLYHVHLSDHIFRALIHSKQISTLTEKDPKSKSSTMVYALSYQIIRSIRKTNLSKNLDLSTNLYIVVEK